MPLGLLVAVVVARSAAAWAFEVGGPAGRGRRALAAAARPRRGAAAGRPTALDGAESAEIATAAVAGVDALETTFARYLPQLVLAVVVPGRRARRSSRRSTSLARGRDAADAAARARCSCGSIGRTTERRARERWQAMTPARDALPRRRARAADAARVQPRRGAGGADRARSSDEYRRATMGTLRVAFLSGAVLELAATLGIALVAVTVGVRLVDGDIGFEAALTVLVLAPELYLPLRNLGAQFHASADGLAVAERLLDLIERPARCAGRQRSGAEPRARRRSRFERVSFAYPGRDAAGARRRRPRARARARRSRSSARAAAARARSRRCSCASRSRPAGRDHRRAASTSPTCDAGGVARAARVGAAAPDALPRHRRRQHPARRPRPPTDARVRAAARRAGADDVRRPRCPTRLRHGRRRRRPAALGRRARGGSRSRGRSSATRRS